MSEKRNHVWIVEMLHSGFRQQGWHATVGAALNREYARHEMARWKARNPDDRFRIRCYWSAR